MAGFSKPPASQDGHLISVRHAVVSIENLTESFSFGEHRRRLLKNGASDEAQRAVLKGVNLDVREGEVLGLLGPNGAGMTTLIEILATLLLPTSGRATVCGPDVVREAAQAGFGLVGLPLSLLAFQGGVRRAKITGTPRHF